MSFLAHARACRRLVALAVITAGYYAYARVATGSLAAIAMKRAARDRHRHRLALLRAWSRVVIRLLNVRVQVHGELPSSAALVVSNHLSYLDVIVLGSVTPMAFVAKAEVARWPIVGALSRFVGTIFVDRTARSTLPRTTLALAQNLADDRRIVIFPEGTSTNGEAVLPFRPALLQPAVDAGLPIACAALRYDTPIGCTPASESVCWWGDMTFVDHIYRLMALPAIDANLAWSDRTLVAADRKTLAQLAHAQVDAQLARLRPAPLASGDRASLRDADDERREPRHVDGLDGDRLQAGGVEQLGET
jgi:1-acyl-sn-glycerol-3-phosphate acyltransferase